MTDYVHDHFARHPGTIRRGITCADGFSISVQASSFHYCSPREDNAERYDSVEVGFPERPDGTGYRIRSFGRGSRGIYGWVPVSTVNRWIKRHGGLAA
jgi:hypothetical protein